MKADAFEQAAMPCLDALYRYAIAITDHAHDAMSLVLATYRTTQDQAERTEPIDMRLALLRTARQLVTPSTAKPAHEHVDLSAVIDDLIGDPPTDELFRTAVRRFPIWVRSILLLWGVEDLTYSQIACVENAPRFLVEEALHEAREALGGLLPGNRAQPVHQPALQIATA